MELDGHGGFTMAVRFLKDLKESYINELKEKILLYAKNNGIKLEAVPLETIIRILIEIRIERLEKEKNGLYFQKGFRLMIPIMTF